MRLLSCFPLLVRFVLVIPVAALVFVASDPAAAETLITSTGYRLEYSVHGKDSNGPIALIVMHGKNAPAERVLSGSNPNANKIAAAGFRVYVPAMPWSSRWDGTHEDATAAIDALVDLAAKDGKKVIVGGHSMGAMFAIVYRATSLPPSVIGKYASAPGHMLDMIPANSNFWAGINPSLARAKSLEAEGKGKERTLFEGQNVINSQSITESYEMTPDVYLSFHDPKRLPSSSAALRAASVPVLWTVGTYDPLFKGSADQSTFGLMPANPKSAFYALDGKNHSTSLPASIEKLIPWLQAFPIR